MYKRQVSEKGTEGQSKQAQTHSPGCGTGDYFSSLLDPKGADASPLWTAQRIDEPPGRQGLVAANTAGSRRCLASAVAQLLLNRPHLRIPSVPLGLQLGLVLRVGLGCDPGPERNSHLRVGQSEPVGFRQRPRAREEGGATAGGRRAAAVAPRSKNRCRDLEQERRRPGREDDRFPPRAAGLSRRPPGQGQAAPREATRRVYGGRRGPLLQPVEHPKSAFQGATPPKL